MIHKYRLRARLVLRKTSAVSANSPPSPRLSARMITRTYLTVTMTTRAQNNQGEGAENGALAHIAKIDQRLSNGVERGGADIAKDDAERSEGQARTSSQAKPASLRRRVQLQRMNSGPRAQRIAPAPPFHIRRIKIRWCVGVVRYQQSITILVRRVKTVGGGLSSRRLVRSGALLGRELQAVADAELCQDVGVGRVGSGSSFCRKPRIKTRRYCTSSACAGAQTSQPRDGGGSAPCRRA